MLVFVSRLVRCRVRNLVAGYRRMIIYVGGMSSCLFNNVSFLSYFLILTSPVNGFAELLATLDNELGSHVDIHFKGQKKATVSCHTPNRVDTK